MLFEKPDGSAPVGGDETKMPEGISDPGSPQHLRQVLQKYWGYDSFLELQAEAMGCVLQGRDSVVVLPTGGGKSLCFQAPAMCLPGLAIIVSPLISLMKDQVDALRSCGVPAAYTNSTLSLQERRQVAQDVRSGAVRLLYLAPERLLSGGTLEFLKGIEVSLIAIDEAHCISAWGHDFRPEYRGLKALKRAFPRVGLHAYTATASEQVRQDIAQQLELSDPKFLVGSFDRPNLIYRVQRRVGRLAQIRQVLDRYANESGIIYCISRKQVDRTAESLRQLGYRALPYHAGMTDQDRRRNQDAFIQERANTIVATVAFGMGIDKSNVRYVIHAGMPKSLEHYQQESGRAGRDGLPAECHLLYTGQDAIVWRDMINDSPPAARPGALKSLEAMNQFCSSVTCRHQAIVEHFGQRLDEDCGQACDVCLGELDLIDDSLTVAQKILSCVLRLQQRFGAEYTAGVLSGSQEQRVIQQGHDRLSTWGILQQESRQTIRDWIEQLVGQKYLAKVGQYAVLEVTDEGRLLLKGQRTPRLMQAADRAQDVASEAQLWEGVDRGLFDVLRQRRLEMAQQQNVPAYVLFHDAALRDMACRRPSTLEGFRLVQGVGEKKLADCGPAFVQCIRQYCQDQQLPMDVTPPPTHRRPSSTSRLPSDPSASAITSFAYFRQGDSVEQVAEKMGRARSTSFGYLLEYLRHEAITDPSPWVDAATVQRIVQASDQVGTERAKPVFELLEGAISYEEIRVVLHCLNNRIAAEE